MKQAVVWQDLMLLLTEMLLVLLSLTDTNCIVMTTTDQNKPPQLSHSFSARVQV
jgi:hypothetical protein